MHIVSLHVWIYAYSCMSVSAWSSPYAACLGVHMPQMLWVCVYILNEAVIAKNRQAENCEAGGSDKIDPWHSWQNICVLLVDRNFWGSLLETFLHSIRTVSYLVQPMASILLSHCHCILLTLGHRLYSVYCILVNSFDCLLKVCCCGF